MAKEFREQKRASKSLLSKLKQIYAAEVTLEESENRKILEHFLEAFRQRTSNYNGLFRMLFKYFYPTGSSYEGLRVKEATEFDINVVFSLPFPVKVVEVRKIPFVAVQPDQPLSTFPQGFPCSESSLACLSDMFNEQGYLIGRKFMSWFQCLVDHYVDTEKSSLPSQVKKVKNSSGGPARTLNFDTGGHWFSVDLVPVLRIDGQKYIRAAQLPGVLHPQNFSECHLVPKPIKEASTLLLTEADSIRLWRVHFPTAEKRIIHRKNALKPVIKLLKCLKEKEGWPIPSYFIKTVGMLLLKNNPDPKYWDEAKMDVRFLQGLEFLFHATANKKLCHTFYPEFNLFHATEKQMLSNISNRIAKILNQLRQDPRCARKFFRCPSHLIRNTLRGVQKLCITNHPRQHL